MKNKAKIVFLLTLSLLYVLVAAGPVLAAWPGNKPATVVIQYGAGGGTDVLTRAYTKAMEKHLGTTVNAMNRAGAVGALAMDFVASKPADGYWWLGASQFSKPLRVMGHTKLVPWEDWQYYKIASGVQGWAVRVDSPFKTMADFIAAAKKEPNKYSIANSGVGGMWHEGNEIMVKAAGIQVRQIPYKGGAPATLACLQGEVDVTGSGIHETIEMIRAGKLRNLAVFTKEQVKFDDGTVLKPITDYLPTLAGYAPFGSEYTLGFKRDTPPEILEKLKQAFIAASNDPEFTAMLKKQFFFKDVMVGEEADRVAALRESVTAWLFWDLKVEGVKVNPAELGLPRPEEFDKWWPPKGYKPRVSSK
jgi:tripartite-type tricarboxylate transporter receptor subunit TctC